MRNIRLMIQFDGTDFSGWQMQAKDRTVQGVLYEALHKLTGQYLILYSSSRTDARVHAIEMPINFQLESNLPLKAFHLGLNDHLPPDVQVLEAADVDLDFNTRFSAKGKTYLYRIQTGETTLPLERRRAWHLRGPLDVDAMKEAAAVLIGQHDFSAFRSAQCDANNPVRTVDNITVELGPDGIINITVTARGFLRNMVRIIAGTLAWVGRGRRDVEWVRGLLVSGDRTQGGVTAPPQGLFLVKVHY